MEGMIQDCLAGDYVDENGNGTPCDERYEVQIGNEREDNKESVPYDNGWLTFMFVYQILMGDATHEHFLEYKGKQSGSWTPYILYALYLVSSATIMILLLNIIIAIMGNTQAERTELGRKVLYRSQLLTVVSRIYKFNQDVTLEDWIDRENARGCCDTLFGRDYAEENALNRVKFFQKKFPRYLTIAYSRATEPESELETLTAKMTDTC